MNDLEHWRAEDARVREEIRTALDATMLVEAGAGTGKTRALVDRLSALVLAGVPIDRIIAITFTEKAAAELRERVRTALEAELRERPEARKILESALTSLDRAPISTIHAFCLDLLRSFAAEAGVDPAFEVQDAVMAERRFQERWRAFLEDLGADPAAVAAVDRALDLGLTTRDIASLALALWGRQELAAELHAWPLTAPDATWPDLDALRRQLAGLPLGRVVAGDRLLVAVTRVIDLVSRLQADPENRDTLLAASAAVLAQSFNTSGRAQSWGGAAVISAARATAAAVRDQLGATLEAIRADALARLLPYVVRFVLEDAGARAREGALVFDDLIVRVRDLLRDNPGATAALQARYDALLIDEFQDTDPLQVEIATAFAGSPRSRRLHPGRLFLVGDPKQSIYRFRRADMAIYARTRDRVETDGGSLPQLALNRRSRRSVVDWVNAVFEAVIGPGDSPEVQPPYRPIHPERDEEPAGPGVASFGKADAGTARDIRRTEAGQIAAHCRIVLDEGWQVFDRGGARVRPASFRDIAVLVPTRAILLPLERALSDAGIPYRVEGGSLIYGTQEVRDVINCLTAIDDPADEVAVVGALRSPAYACSDVELGRFRAGGGRFNYLHTSLDGQEGRVADALRGLRDFHQARHKLSLAALVEGVVTDRGLIEIGILDQGSRNAFRRARFVIEQARAFEARGPESLRAFVGWLERRATGAILDYEGAGLDDDEDAVRILTIHAAKGLEFPIVILAGLGVSPSNLTPIFGTDRATGQIAVQIGAKTQNLRFKLGPADTVEAQERLHADAERDRLLYVGATRARDHLLVSLYHSVRATKTAAQRLLDAGVLDHCPLLPPLPPIAASEVAPFADLEIDAPAGLDAFKAGRTELIGRARKQRVTSATALGRRTSQSGREGDEDEEDKAERQDETEPWARGRGGTHLGRAVHAALQSVAWDADAAQIDAVARAQAVAEAIPGRAGEVARLLRRALASEAAQRARSARRALREVPFALVRDGVILEGFADLVVETVDGIEIVDWKTDAVDAAAVPQRLESYRLQAGLYVLGLEAATRRPVTRVTYVFVAPGIEVSPGAPAELATAAASRLVSNL